MDARILLTGTDRFTKAKEALVWLYEHRAEVELHEIEIRPYKSKRNTAQNALMWAVLTEIAKQIPDENGKRYSPETWHEYFKATILGRDCIEVDGKEHWVSKSTTALNVAEFSDYVTQIQAWAVDHGVAFHIDSERAA